MGYYILFEVNRYLVRDEMQAVIRNHPGKLVVLKLEDVSHNKDFQRIHKKEFRYRGEMYDVLREVTTGTTTLFICLHDVKETRLFAGLKKVHQDKLHLALPDQVTMIHLPIHSEASLPILTGSLVFARLVPSLNSVLLPISSPPPKFL